MMLEDIFIEECVDAIQDIADINGVNSITPATLRKIMQQCDLIETPQNNGNIVEMFSDKQKRLKKERAAANAAIIKTLKPK